MIYQCFDDLRRRHKKYAAVVAQWVRGRASDFRLKGPEFKSYAAVLKPWASLFHSTLLQFTQLYKGVHGIFVYDQYEQAKLPRG